MKNYKIITTPTTTRYILESATAGATSAGNVASTEQPVGNIITREADKNKVPQKPRQGPLRPQTGGGKHKDKKRAEKQGDVKHKKPFMENHPDHEVEMAQADTYQLAKQAAALHKMLMRASEMQGLEGWQQAKITKAADYINAVYKNLAHDVAMDGDIDESNLQELDKPSGTMFLKFMKKQLPDREMSFYAFAGFGNTPDDVRAANAKIKPFIVGDIDELEYNINKIFRDVDFVGVEKMVVDARNVPDGMMPDVEALVDLDDRLEFYTDDSDDDEEDGGGGKMQHYVIGPDGKKRKVPVPGKPSAQVAGSSHNTPVQPKTYKYTLQRTELMPKLRDMGFKFQGNQIILSKQQRDQLVQKLGSQFQSIFSQSDKFTEAGNERNKRNPTRDFLRRYPVPQDQMVKPVKKPEKKKPEQGVAEGSNKNVVKSIKVGNFRHDLVDTEMGWQVRIYNGDELYDTGMSKNSEQKGLAALEDAVAYTEKQTRTKREGVAEEKQKGVDGKACWKGYKRMGTKKKGGRTVDNCVPVGEDAYMESLWSQLDEYKFTSLPYKGQKKEKQAPFALGSKHIGKAGGSSKSKGALSGMKASTSKDSNKPVVSTEAAPPGDKYERMVKHIKKGYAKDGKITDKERSIAYATAWKAKNKAKK